LKVPIYGTHYRLCATPLTNLPRTAPLPLQVINNNIAILVCCNIFTKKDYDIDVPLVQVVDYHTVSRLRDEIQSEYLKQLECGEAYFDLRGSVYGHAGGCGDGTSGGEYQSNVCEENCVG
jgi:hypothetical protein